ncbi:MAG TPA: phage head closure protein [Propylenella sp.]
MNAGDMDRRITIRSIAVVNNTRGEPIATEATFLANEPARVRQKSGRELVVSDQIQAERTTEFTVRYRAGFEETMRITYEGDDYDILAIEEIGRRHWLRLVTTRHA